MPFPIIRADLWKVVAVVCFGASFAFAHQDIIPALLVPYKGWIELVAFFGTIWNAFQMQPERRSKSRDEP